MALPSLGQKQGYVGKNQLCEGPITAIFPTSGRSSCELGHLSHYTGKSKKSGTTPNHVPHSFIYNNVIRYICSLVSRLFAMIIISSTAFAGERILTSPPNWKTHA